MINVKHNVDVAIIGGGIVGLATARQLLIRHPKLKVCIIEKEKELASHQSKRNSGVVHRGIYYKVGSLKSRFCIKGAKLAEEYCNKKSIPFVKCGKLIVATHKDQLQGLEKLYENAQANQVKNVRRLMPKLIRDIQPGCTRAIEALWSPETAIVDWQHVAWSFAKDFVDMKGQIIRDFATSNIETDIDGSLLIERFIDGEFIRAKSIINCAGLFSDLFARLTGNDEHPKVVPFKGHYYYLNPNLAKSIKTNIYPVPNDKLPFLGVHITPRLNGSVLLGPTALPTLGYENYDRQSGMRFDYVRHILFRSGLRHMFKKPEFITAAFLEIWRLVSKERLASELRELIPAIRAEDIKYRGFCGIRAQTVSRDGHLVDDFLFEFGLKPEFSRVLHVRNCPSPAATSSMAIAERVVDIVSERLL